MGDVVLVEGFWGLGVLRLKCSGFGCRVVTFEPSVLRGFGISLDLGSDMNIGFVEKWGFRIVFVLLLFSVS